MTTKTPIQEIDDIINLYGGWKGKLISKIRQAVLATNPEIVEEVKWKMKTRPEGLPVWSYKGIVCLCETFKNDIKLVYTKGAFLKAPNDLFNARQNSKTDRAIMFVEGDKLDMVAITDLTKLAVEFNKNK